ncbi:non-specific serine/threonine protein kinase OS=Lysinibacillus sphaericus OX=1421 GN=prkC PE=4 SV=1 [Lysinibacillus sphaericus]
MLVGKRISDRYKIIELIGGGGMSNVYLAHDMILNRDVAIKILRYDFTNEDELHRRFQREALSVTSLTHPNIVSIYDVGDDGDLHYIVMEYVQGKTLKQYIQEFAPISPARSVHIMKQLTSAIANTDEGHFSPVTVKEPNFNTILLDPLSRFRVNSCHPIICLTKMDLLQDDDA